MALIIPPGYLQAVYVFLRDADSEEMVVTCGHELDAASGANSEDCADDLFGAFNTHLVPHLSSPTQFIGVVCYVGQDGGGSLVVESAQPAVRGPNTGTVVPQNTAALIRKRTGLAGRRGRGRMYWPDVPESQVGNTGDLATSYMEPFQQGLDDWYEALTGLVGGRLYPPVVLHRSEGIGPEPLPTPITRFVLEGRVATQRRRLRP